LTTQLGHFPAENILQRSNCYSCAALFLRSMILLTVRSYRRFPSPVALNRRSQLSGPNTFTPSLLYHLFPSTNRGNHGRQYNWYLSILNAYAQRFAVHFDSRCSCRQFFPCQICFE
jgi:hypothetical protein